MSDMTAKPGPDWRFELATIREAERITSEATWDEAADLLQGEYDDEDASLYLFEMNPHRKPGETYCPIHGVGDHTIESCEDE